MSKFCGNCGNQLNDNAVFCTKCGTKQAAFVPNTSLEQNSAIQSKTDSLFAINKKTLVKKILTLFVCGAGAFSAVACFCIAANDVFTICIGLLMLVFAILPIACKKTSLCRKLLVVPYILLLMAALFINLVISYIGYVAPSIVDAYTYIERSVYLGIIFSIITFPIVFYYVYIIRALTTGVQSKRWLRVVLTTVAIISGIIAIAIFYSDTPESNRVAIPFIVVLFVYPAVVVPNVAKIKPLISETQCNTNTLTSKLKGCIAKTINLMLLGIMGIYVIARIFVSLETIEKKTVGCCLFVVLHAINVVAFIILPVICKKMLCYRKLLTVSFVSLPITTLLVNNVLSAYSYDNYVDIIKATAIIIILAIPYYIYIIRALTVGVKNKQLLKRFSKFVAEFGGSVGLEFILFLVTDINFNKMYSSWVIGASSISVFMFIIFVYSAVVVPDATKQKFSAVNKRCNIISNN